MPLTYISVRVSRVYHNWPHGVTLPSKLTNCWRVNSLIEAILTAALLLFNTLSSVSSPCHPRYCRCTTTISRKTSIEVGHASTFLNYAPTPIHRLSNCLNVYVFECRHINGSRPFCQQSVAHYIHPASFDGIVWLCGRPHDKLTLT